MKSRKDCGCAEKKKGFVAKTTKEVVSDNSKATRNVKKVESKLVSNVDSKNFRDKVKEGLLLRKGGKMTEKEEGVPVEYLKNRNISKLNIPDQVFNVPGDFATIQEAIDAASDPAFYTEINIAPGVYEENLTIGPGRAAAGTNVQTREFYGNDVYAANVIRGLQINGDNRRYLPTYANGTEFSSNTVKNARAFLETDVPGVGPYLIVLANYGFQPPLGDVLVSGAQVSDDFLACGPVSNTFAGDIALVSRGGCGFVTKTENVQNAGAAACIVVNTSEGIFTMGGTTELATIPSYMISNIDGNELKTAIENNPGIQLTINNPTTLYDPPLGTNYGTVQLSQPAANQVKVEIVNPIPIVDPNLPRGESPILEQPNFEDISLKFVPGDKVIINESNWASQNVFTFFAGGNGTGVKEFEIAAINGNVLTFTEDVDPNVVDVTAAGCSLSFMPNVVVKAAAADVPTSIVRANSVNFSMNGIRTESNLALPFGSTTGGFEIYGCDAFLSNLTSTDIFGWIPGFDFSITESNIAIYDGYRNDSTNRRLLGLGPGMFITNSTVRGGDLVQYGNGGGGFGGTSGIAITGGSFVNPNSIISMGNCGLYQAEVGYGLNVESSQVRISAMLIVTDIYGTGIQASDSSIFVAGGPDLRVERCTFPAGNPKTTAGIYLSGSQLGTGTSNQYTGSGDFTSRIRENVIISGCKDISDKISAISGFKFCDFTWPNTGIIVEAGTFSSDDDIIYVDNDNNYTTYVAGTLDTRGYSQSPENVLIVESSGTLDPGYALQELRPGVNTITFDPSATYKNKSTTESCRFVEIDMFEKSYVGKTFTLMTKENTSMCLKLESGNFIGACKGTVLRFMVIAGASITFRVLNDTEVFVLGSFGVLPASAGAC